MNKLNNFKNQFSFFKTNLTNLPNLTQENKYLIAEIFFSIITLILIIIIILNKPSGGSGLNNVIVGIIGVKYPFIEAILKTITAFVLSEQLFDYLETFINLVEGIFNIITEIMSLIIQYFKNSLMPEVVLCEEGVELIRVFSDDLKDIKESYCGDNLLKYLAGAIDDSNRMTGIDFTSPIGYEYLDKYKFIYFLHT
jgi:hypothetical protein